MTKKSIRRQFVSDPTIGILISKSNQELYSDARLFFMRHTSSIEVLRNKHLQRVSFALPPYTYFLTDATKEWFLNIVDRSSTKNKLLGLLRHSDYLIDRAKIEMRLIHLSVNVPILKPLLVYGEILKDIEFYLLMFVNLAILFSYCFRGNVNYLYEPVFMGFFYNFEPAVNTVGSTIIFFKVAGVLMAATSFVRAIISEMLREAPIYFKNTKPDPLIKTRPLGRLIKGISRWVNNLFTMFWERPLFLYYIIYCMLSLLGAFFHPFCFVLMMTEVFIRYKMLQNVIKSVWVPRKQLIYTFLLLWMVIYIFTLYAYLEKTDKFSRFELNRLSAYLFQIYDLTFKYNGGIGGFFEEDPTDDYKDGVIYDSLYNLIIVFFMFKIVSGIIIDTFAILRSDYEKLIYDKESVCFVCGFDRNTFDKVNDTKNLFLGHWKNDHNIWSYLFYIAYLKEKDVTEYTGIESYVHQQLLLGEINWLPINKALSLKSIEQEDDNDVVKRLAEIDSNVNIILNLA